MGKRAADLASTNQRDLGTRHVWQNLVWENLVRENVVREKAQDRGQWNDGQGEWVLALFGSCIQAGDRSWWYHEHRRLLLHVLPDQFAEIRFPRAPAPSPP